VSTQLSQFLDRAIATSRDASSLLAGIAAALAAELQAEVCGLAVRCSERGVRVAWSRSDTEIAPDATIADLPATVPVTVTALDTAREPGSELVRQTGMAGWLGCGLPIGSAGTVGAVFGRARAWEPLPTLDLTDCCDRLALAFERARLLDVEQRAERDRALRQTLGTALAAGSDLDDIRARVLAAVGTALHGDRGWVLGLKYDNPLASTPADAPPAATVEVNAPWRSRDTSAQLDPNLTFALGDVPHCWQGWQQAPDPVAGPLRSDSPLAVGARANAQMAVAPLLGRAGGTVLGFLALQRSPVWERGDLDLMQWAALQLGTATLNHQILQNVRGLVDERTAQLQQSLEVQARLYETTRQQVEQLRQLNRLKDDFLSTISHELNTPLTTMRIAVKMLSQPNLDADRRRRYLGILEGELRRESNLIRDLLALQQLERGPASSAPDDAAAPSGPVLPAPTAVDLAEAIASLTREVAAQWQARGLTSEVTYEPPLAPGVRARADESSLRRVLQELLANAGKYAQPDTTVRLTLRASGDDRVAIAICNQGRGIPSDELPYVFERFRRGRGATERAIPGTGLGLALVRSLTRQLDGTIEVTSDYRDGEPCETCFTLTLPLATTFEHPTA